MACSMKHLPAVLILSTALSLSACGEMGQQWLDPDVTFATFGQPTVKGVNDTQEEMAKEADRLKTGAKKVHERAKKILNDAEDDVNKFRRKAGKKIGFGALLFPQAVLYAAVFADVTLLETDVSITP